VLSWDLTTRCSAIAITGVLVWLLGSDRYWVGLVISFGLAHYLLSFYYAAGRMRGLVVSPTLALPLVSLGLLLVVVYFLKFPLEIYFGIHHACNEGYLRRYHRQADGTADPQLQGLSRLRDSSVEWLVLAVVGLSLLVKISFLQMVMYHFVLWTIIPVPVLRAAGTHKLIEYALLSFGTLDLFAALTITQLGSNLVPLSAVYSQFYFWSYVHITASFALSAAHPDWIVQLFRVPQAQRG
jgi:hypothetical protein